MNSFGRVFRITTWGESHGPALGVVIDGCPARLPVDDNDIFNRLKLDVPDQELGTPRGEKNRFQILSGVFDGMTIGTPISIIIWNNDARPESYSGGRDTLRPGHADYTWLKRFGHTDWRGGSRASGRECIARLAAGAIALKILEKFGVSIKSRIIEMAGIEVTDAKSMENARDKALEIGKTGDSTGGAVELIISGLPAGTGSPVFAKLHADLSSAMFSIGGIKAVQFGVGTEVSAMKGSELNDSFDIDKDGEIFTETNSCGGILGGISTGDDLTIKLSVKPTPTVLIPQKTVDIREKKQKTVKYSGRFDMNFVPRIPPVAESMTAFVLVDHLMLSGIIPTTKLQPES
ncbi:MAG: chorismate synthase [Candidatus Riflebacteria bacterium]|nr:chorismate synthase [Candidatus Riflebacteria bacterium]